MADEAGCSKYRWVMLGVVCALSFMENGMQYQVSTFAVELMSELSIDTLGFSTLFLAPMLTALFLGIPLGALGDRLGPRIVVTCGSLVSVLGAVMRALTLSSFTPQVVSLLLIGVGMAALSVNVVKVLGTWFGARVERAMGAYYASAGLGITAAQITGGLFASVGSAYAYTAWLFCVPVLLWMVLARDVRAVTPIEASSPFRVAARSRNVWLIAVSVGFSLAATTAFSGFLPQALELERGKDIATAGFLAAVVTVSGVIGCILGPSLCAAVGRVKAFLMVVIVVASTAMALTWSVEDNALIVLLTVNGLVAAMTAPIVQALVVSLPEIGCALAGSAAGIVGTVSLFLSFALPLVISTIAGGDYVLHALLDGGCFLLSGVPLLLVPMPSRIHVDNVAPASDIAAR